MTLENKIASRRSFFKAAALGLAGIITVPSQSFSKDDKKEGKKKVEYDRDLLVCNYKWIDSESEREQYNQFSREYMDVLANKGKFDPEKVKALKELYETNINLLSPAQVVMLMKKDLLREKDPEAYLKQYVKEEERDKIKEIKIKFRSKKEKEKFDKESCWKIKIDSPDLSDKIYLYETAKNLKNLFDNLDLLPKNQVAPLKLTPF